MKNRIPVLSKPGQPRENVSVQWLMKNQIHVLSTPGQSRETVSLQWLVNNQIHVLSKPGQPRRECQRSMAYEKSNSRTL